MKDPFYVPTSSFNPYLVESASLGNLELYIRGQAAQFLAGSSEEAVEQALLRVAVLFDDWAFEDIPTSPTTEPMRGTTLNLIRVSDADGNPVLQDGTSTPHKMRLFSPTLELFYRSESPELAAAFDGLDLHWPGLLAVLSLGYLNAAGQLRDQAFDSSSVTDAMKLADQASALVAYALEAISLADRCLGEDSFVQRHFRALTQNRNTAAGRARHSKTDALKKRFRAYFEGGTWSSHADCARRFLAGLSDADQRLLSKSNAVRTLTESLRKSR